MLHIIHLWSILLTYGSTLLIYRSIFSYISFKSLTYRHNLPYQLVKTFLNKIGQIGKKKSKEIVMPNM